MCSNIPPATKMIAAQELAYQLHRGNVVLWWGWRGDEILHLMQMLAKKCGYADPLLDLAAVAGYYEYEARGGRQALIACLQDALVASSDDVSMSSQILTKLPIRQIISPRIDNYVERALGASAQQFRTIVDDIDAKYVDSKPFLIKLHGSLDRPESLVLTKADQDEYFVSHPRVVEWTRNLLTSQTWLLINEIEDDSIKRLLSEVNYNAGQHKRRHYALNCYKNPNTWLNQGVELLPHRIDAFVAAIGEKLSNIAPRESDSFADESLHKTPYKFLDYFTSEDKSLFFGREDAIRDLVEQITSCRLTVLYGRSGVGKTSLLRAGVIPKLEASAFVCMYVRFGKDPEWTIKQELLRLCSSLGANSLPDLSLPLHEYVIQTSDKLHSPLIIFVDQFEEFETRLAPVTRGVFAKAMGELLQVKSGSVKFVLSIREDFLGILDELRPDVFEPLAHTYRLTNLERDGARQAIENPAAQYGLEFDQNAVEYILDGLVEKSDIQERVFPPHLQIVCYRIFESLPENMRFISQTFIQGLGGVEKLLDEYLQVSLATLRPEDQDSARSILKQLVSSAGTKALKRQDEFVDGDDIDILDLLIERRLVRRISEGHEIYYELAHDQLADSIKGWIDIEEQQAKDVFEMLTQEVNNRLYWERKGETYLGVDVPKLRRVYEQHNKYLHLTTEMQKLLLNAALMHGYELDFWINLVKDTQEAVEVICQVVIGSEVERKPLAGLKGRVSNVNPAIRESLVQCLVSILDDSDRSNRLKAAYALWQLRQDLKRNDLFKVLRTIVVLRLALQSTRTIPKLAASAAALLLLVSGLSIAILWGTRVACQNGTLPADGRVCQLVNPKAPIAQIEPPKHDMIMIPAGDFVSGTGDNSEESYLDVYYIDRYEVTNGLYKLCVQAGVCRAPVNSVFDLEEYQQHPVTDVSLDDARDYCSWIGGYLPSELQWEKAARGTDGFEHPWGNEPIKEGRANICDAQCPESLRVESIDDGFPQTAPVGSFPLGASPFGVEDMVGNVWEWTSDGVAKGGSWRNDRRLSKTTSRISIDPDTRDPSLGFRCASSTTQP